VGVQSRTVCGTSSAVVQCVVAFGLDTVCYEYLDCRDDLCVYGMLPVGTVQHGQVYIGEVLRFSFSEA
jgi:hypothetical protein